MATSKRSAGKQGSRKPPGRPTVVSREEVGKRLRAIRKARKRTLKMLSAESGIAVSTISKMELGQIAVSYEKFGAIARALQIDPSRLFDAEEGDESGPQPTVLKSSVSSEYMSENYSYRMLAGDYPGKKMTPMLGLVVSRERQQFADFVRHPGQEFVMVLSGSVRIEFETGESIGLKRNESAYFNSGVGHIYLSVGRGNAQIMVVCTDM
jgi:transcriptional regulator with XRE-family HTH domain